QATMGAIFAFLDLRIEDSLMHHMPRVARDRRGAASTLFGRTLEIDAATSVAFTAIAIAVVYLSGLGSGGNTRASYLSLAAVQNGVSATVGTSSVGFALTGALDRLGVITTITTVIISGLSLGGLLAWGP